MHIAHGVYKSHHWRKHSTINSKQNWIELSCIDCCQQSKTRWTQVVWMQCFQCVWNICKFFVIFFFNKCMHCVAVPIFISPSEHVLCVSFEILLYTSESKWQSNLSDTFNCSVKSRESRGNEERERDRKNDKNGSQQRDSNTKKTITATACKQENDFNISLCLQSIFHVCV